jgi:hypothetical protein
MQDDVSAATAYARGKPEAGPRLRPQYSLLGGDVYADLRAALDAAVPVAA